MEGGGAAKDDSQSPEHVAGWGAAPTMAETLDYRLEIRSKLVSHGMGVPESLELPGDPLELSSASAVQLISPCPRLALYCHLLKGRVQASALPPQHGQGLVCTALSASCRLPGAGSSLSHMQKFPRMAPGGAEDVVKI